MGWSGAERAQSMLPRLQDGVQVRESFDAHGGRAYIGRIVQLPKFPKHNSSTSKDCIMDAQEDFGDYGGRTISCAIMPPMLIPMMCNSRFLFQPRWSRTSIMSLAISEVE